MGLYKVVAGQHYEINQNVPGKPRDPDRMKLYKAGDVFESERELDKIYANKFEKVIPGVNAPIVVSEARRRAVTLLVQQGAWDEEDRKFLEELPDEGFARIQLRSKPKEEETRKVTSLGEDVTDKFQQAYDNGFKVYRNILGKHQVVKPGGKKPINKDPLEEGEVEKFVADFLAEA